MAYWLMKTEPEEFSWNDQVKRGGKGEPWSGVRNFIARRNLKDMKKGEKFFFYHTGEEKQIVGIGEIIREAYPDPTAKKGEPWVAVTTAVYYQSVEAIVAQKFLGNMTDSNNNMVLEPCVLSRPLATPLHNRPAFRQTQRSRCP